MSKASRDKGKRGEREVAEILRDHGFEDARRGQQYKGSPDSPDVVGIPGFHIEVKRTEQCRLYEYMDQAVEDSDGGDIPVVWHRQSRKPWVVIMLADDFMEIAKRASE